MYKLARYFQISTIAESKCISKSQVWKKKMECIMINISLPSAALTK